MTVFSRRFIKILLTLLIITGIGGGVWGGFYVYRLSQAAKDKFGSKKWELPARIYARPLELYRGLELPVHSFEQELSLMAYRRTERIDAAGSYARSGDAFTLFTRPFRFEDGEEPARKLRVTLEKGRIESLMDISTGEFLELVRLDPAHIGSFYPTHNQDRLWVPFKDTPPLLIQTLLAIEDRDFYHHYGVRPTAILRALIVNIREGRKVQGGSTLTQQLVKNLFLSNEQTVRRKINEAIMALSLEWTYEKDQIFEAYINEVYLGQDGNRAIHGFGMASRFFFGRALDDLRPGEVALLVGLLKGPSYYDPRRNTERSRKRRDLVVRVMEDQKLIRPHEARAALDSDLGVTPRPPSGSTRFPAFMDLVKRRLLKEYPEDELRSEGLRIFTFLDPQVQFAAENAIENRLSAIESWRGFPAGELESAAIVTDTAGNAVLALAGGRTPGLPGFNRALDARRHIGSLMKPVVYLTALRQPDRYTLISPLEDTEIEVRDRDKVWRPRNYDRVFHGPVPLYSALVHSYNAATVRLGMDVGLDAVFRTLKELGADGEFPPYPSALLGAVSMSVLDAARIYQTLAAGGFSSPVTPIHGVYRQDGTALQRYPLTIRSNIEPGAVFLLNKALQSVAVEGTASSLRSFLKRELNPAGKTGTSNDLRDSWFAGFTGNRLAVVWVGRDDSTSCGLTGASGALPVWGEMMSRILNTPLRLSQPENVEWTVVDPRRNLRTHPNCPGAVSVPFLKGSEPETADYCGYASPDGADDNGKSPGKKSIFDLLKDMF